MGGLVLEALTAAVAHPQHVSLAGNALFCRGRRLYPVLTCVSESSNGSRDLNLTCFENGPNGLSVFEKTVDRLRENWKPQAKFFGGDHACDWQAKSRSKRDLAVSPVFDQKCPFSEGIPPCTRLCSCPPFITSTGSHFASSRPSADGHASNGCRPWPQ